jgi:hypothetical protein
MGILLTGSIPGLINEGTPLWDWMGQLRLTIDPALIRFVDLTGIGGDFFDATLNRSTAMVEIRPISVMDYEWFTANGVSPVISLSLRFFMMDGSVESSSGSYLVRVLSLDDTPPQALRFASGGSVQGGLAGAVIGTLEVEDPDTASGFVYTVREDDQWMFEVVDGTLRLKDGISIPMGDGPTRPVVIEVWDGSHSTAFTLDITVTMPTGGIADTLEPGERQDNFHWSNNITVQGYHMIHEIASLTRLGDYRQITMRDGEVITFEGAHKIQLLDGTVYFDANSTAAWIWNAYDTILNRESRNYEMLSVDLAFRDGWLSKQQFITNLLTNGELDRTQGSLSNTQFVEMLYRNTSGTINSSGVAYHAGRLDQGMSRARIVEDFMAWRETAYHQVSDRAEEGIFVLTAYAQQVDVLYKVGGGYPSNSDYTFWIDRIASGRITLYDLAEAVSNTSGYADRLGRLNTHDFVAEFYNTAVGVWADDATVTALAQWLDAGAMSRVQFMELVAWNISVPNSYVYHAPEGIAFGNPW